MDIFSSVAVCCVIALGSSASVRNWIFLFPVSSFIDAVVFSLSRSVGRTIYLLEESSYKACCMSSENKIVTKKSLGPSSTTLLRKRQQRDCQTSEACLYALNGIVQYKLSSKISTEPSTKNSTFFP